MWEHISVVCVVVGSTDRVWENTIGLCHSTIFVRQEQSLEVNDFIPQ